MPEIDQKSQRSIFVAVTCNFTDSDTGISLSLEFSRILIRG